MSRKVFEVVSFKLKPGMKVEEFQRAAARSQRFLGGCRGYLSRDLLFSQEANCWVDIVQWSSLEDAQAAAKAFNDAPDARDFVGFIDPTDMKFMHMDAVPLHPL